MFAFYERNTTLRLVDGSELLIPNDFFYRLEFLDHEPHNTVLRGDCRNLSSAFFLFLSQKSKREKGYDPLAAMLRAVELPYKLSIPIRREIPALKGRFRVVQITSTGPLEGFLVLTSTQERARGVVSFFLVGPEAEFQRALPGFVAMVNQYGAAEAKSVKKGLSQRNHPSSWMVIAAIVVLVANIFAILFGFKEIARRGNDEEMI